MFPRGTIDGMSDAKPAALKVDEVGRAFRRRRVRLKVELRDGDAEFPFVLIEGSKSSLEYLGNLLLAMASDDDCGFEVGPHGPGNVFFHKDSLGIYIHRLPCVNDLLARRGYAK